MTNENTKEEAIAAWNTSARDCFDCSFGAVSLDKLTEEDKERIRPFVERTCTFFPSWDIDVWGEEFVEEMKKPPQPGTFSTMEPPDCLECSSCGHQYSGFKGKMKMPDWVKCCPNCGARVVGDA